MESLLENTDKKGDFCFLANIKTYLGKYNLQYDEYWLGGIVGVMGFYYTTITTGIPAVIHGRSEEFEGLYADLMDCLLEPLQIEQFTKKEEVFNRITDLLKAGVTPMMWMDEYFLPEAYNYQKNHLWVMAVILESNDLELLIFNNEEMRVSKAEMDLMMRREEFIELQYTMSGQLGWKYPQVEMAIKGLQRVARNISKKVSSKEEFYGLEGMKVFISKFQYSRNYEEIYDFFYQMNRGGGLYKTRRNMKLFLEEIVRRWTGGEANSCIAIYEDLEEKWTKITNLIFKLSVCKDLALQQRIVSRIEQVILLEEQGIEEIYKLIGALTKKKYED